MEMELLL